MRPAEALRGFQAVTASDKDRNPVADLPVFIYVIVHNANADRVTEPDLLHGRGEAVAGIVGERAFADP